MRKPALFNLAVLITIGSLIGLSCKKVINSNAPTPNNVRLLGYNKITNISQSVPIAIPTSKITESFRFYYDESNRVSQILHNGNDSTLFQMRIDFTYVNDTILKTITDILTNQVVERDTFIKNADGAIVTAYTPGYKNTSVKHTFEYYGKLLSRITKTATNWTRASATSSVTYTSVNGDWLKQTAGGKLDCEFTNMTPGLDIDWITDTKYFGHIEDLMEYKYTFNPYTHTKDIRIWVQDTLQDTTELIYPAWDWANESYQFYTENANRVGDWLQLESFTMYGQNIYRNSHLVESIAARNKNAYIDYKYDAQSKITQTSVVVTDSTMNKRTYTYDLQYETF
jgi:hypothetical protein